MFAKLGGGISFGRPRVRESDAFSRSLCAVFGAGGGSGLCGGAGGCRCGGFVGGCLRLGIRGLGLPSVRSPHARAWGGDAGLRGGGSDPGSSAPRLGRRRLASPPGGGAGAPRERMRASASIRGRVGARRVGRTGRSAVQLLWHVWGSGLRSCLAWCISCKTPRHFIHNMVDALRELSLLYYRCKTRAINEMGTKQQQKIFSFIPSSPPRACRRVWARLRPRVR